MPAERRLNPLDALAGVARTARANAASRPTHAMPPPGPEIEAGTPRLTRRGRPRFEDLYTRATFHLTPEQLAAIDALSRDTGIGKSELVRDAVDTLLTRYHQRP